MHYDDACVICTGSMYVMYKFISQVLIQLRGWEAGRVLGWLSSLQSDFLMNKDNVQYHTVPEGTSSMYQDGFALVGYK